MNESFIRSIMKDKKNFIDYQNNPTPELWEEIKHITTLNLETGLSTPIKPKHMKTVFLGGTCNGSLWRDYIIGKLNENVDAYNPVVADWTPACMEEELRRREDSNICLYFITPLMTGVYSIAEAVEDSIKRPDKTVFAFMDMDQDVSFTSHQLKSLVQTGKLIRDNGALFLNGIDDVIEYLNR